MPRLPVHGLYAVTRQRYPDLRRLGREVQAALEGGAAMIQFRDKSNDPEWRLDAARHLKALCEASNTVLIINDDAQLARAAGADGVHLGREDASIAVARNQAGEKLIVGVSCYNDPVQAARAAAGGADYLAFGSMFPSSTKPGAARCTLETLSRMRHLGLPLVAIGGISPENGAPVIGAGADFLAVISGVFEATDIRQAAERYTALWPPKKKGQVHYCPT